MKCIIFIYRGLFHNENNTLQGFESDVKIASKMHRRLSIQSFQSLFDLLESPRNL